METWERRVADNSPEDHWYENKEQREKYATLFTNIIPGLGSSDVAKDKDFVKLPNLELYKIINLSYEILTERYKATLKPLDVGKRLNPMVNGQAANELFCIMGLQTRKSSDRNDKGWEWVPTENGIQFAQYFIYQGGNSQVRWNPAIVEIAQAFLDNHDGVQLKGKNTWVVKGIIDKRNNPFINTRK